MSLYLYLRKETLDDQLPWNILLVNQCEDEQQDPIQQNQGPCGSDLQNQAGFRPGRSCAQKIHIFTRMMKVFQDYQLPLTITFIDFKKAFYSVDKKVMFAVLRHYGIPVAVVNAISALIPKVQYWSTGNISDSFEISTGVLQGDVYTPFLFIMVVVYLMRKATSYPDSEVEKHPCRSAQDDIQPRY